MKYRLADKAEQVQKYADTTDWLVIDIKQTGSGELDYDLASNPVDDISPFRKVALIVWRNWQPFIATWTVEDGKWSATFRTCPMKTTDTPRSTTSLKHGSFAIDRAVGRYRMQSMLKGENPMRIPHLTLAPGTAQWYQYWMGPYPWVSCWMLKGRTDAVTVAFWTNGDWKNRQPYEQDTDDVEGLAEKIWDFLKPSS